jgi:hypothetical protein
MAVRGLWLAWHSRSTGLRTLIGRLVAFGLPAILIGLPWYLKNWALTGNPVYPTYWGGLDWPPERTAALMTYLQSFGTGRQWLDFVLAPINLYTQFGRFTTFQGSIEMPGLLFPLVMLYPLGCRSRALDTVALITALQYVIWLLGSQQSRFLLPLFPSLSLLTASVILGLVDRVKRPAVGRVFAVGLVAGLLSATLVYQLLYFVQVKPLEVIVGTESADAFLQRNLHDYQALNYINTQLPATARVMFLWDSQGYYCDARCQPDTEPSRWTEIVRSTQTVLAVATQLEALGTTHLMVSTKGGAFVREHDPDGEAQRAIDFFFAEFQPVCSTEVYRDEWTAVYELTCASGS